VFAGGATLEAAEVVCDGEGVAARQVLDLLGRLVARSLVQAREREGQSRYGLLETVRAYAWERLEESGETAGMVRAHADLYQALAEAAAPELTGPEQAAWLAQLEAEHDNLRAVLRWATASGAGETGLRLAGALWRFWAIRGHLREGQGWLVGLLAPDARGVPAAVRARALNGAGNLAHLHGDYARARAWHEEALALRDALRAPRLPAEQAALDQVAGAARDSLGEESYRAAWQAGRGLSLEAAVEEVGRRPAALRRGVVTAS
jgi:hypothetical protein